MRTLTKLAGAAAVLLFAAVGSYAQSTTGNQGAKPNNADNIAGHAPKLAAADRKFMEKAAAGGLAEVEMGRLAQQKGASPQVKDFGARMEKDHGKANDELKQLASSKGVQLPAETSKEQQSKIAKMEKLSGASFDKAYMADMLADHKKDVAEFRKVSKSATDPDVKTFAGKTLPTLEEHLKLAQDTDKAVRK